jgi:hypothetical protein
VVADPEIATILRTFRILILLSESASMSWLFPAESHSSGGFLVLQLVIPSKKHSARGFLVYEVVIPGRSTIYPVEAECWQSAPQMKFFWWIPRL